MNVVQYDAISDGRQKQRILDAESRRANDEPEIIGSDAVRHGAESQPSLGTFGTEQDNRRVAGQVKVSKLTTLKMQREQQIEEVQMVPVDTSDQQIDSQRLSDSQWICDLGQELSDGGGGGDRAEVEQNNKGELSPNIFKADGDQLTTGTRAFIKDVRNMDLKSEPNLSKSNVSNKEAKVSSSMRGTKPRVLMDMSARDTEKDGAQKSNGGNQSSYKGNFLDQMDDEYEPLSHKKLLKVIEKLHPIDPETKKQFSVKDRVTVKDYCAKLSDACFCYAFGKFVSKCSKKIQKKLRGEPRKFQPPPSLEELPTLGSSSESTEEVEEGGRGLTTTSRCLGDGSALYLQTLRTFAIMFAILSFVNMPLYMIYQSATADNNFTDINSMFQYFTLGNLGRANLFCAHQSLEGQFISSSQETEPIKLECPFGGIITHLHTFGLLYREDLQTGRDSDAANQCAQINKYIYNDKKVKQNSNSRRRLLPNTDEGKDQKSSELRQLSDPTQNDAQKDCIEQCIDKDFDYCVRDGNFDSFKKGTCCKDESCIKQLGQEACSSKQMKGKDKLLKYFACPNVQEKRHNCGHKKVLDILSNINHVFKDVKFDTAEATKDEKQICSYQIRGPSTLEPLDKTWLQFLQVKNAKVTVIAGGREYQYMNKETKLHGQVLENPSAGIGDYILGGNQSLFIIIERDLSNVDFTQGKTIESSVQFEAYIEKSLKKSFKKTQNTERLLNTPFGIDPNCDMNSMWNDQKDKKNQTSKEQFQSYFDKQCQFKQNCSIQFHSKGNINIMPLIREQCIDRMTVQNITSYQTLVVVGCQSDYVTIPIFNQKLHKQRFGIMIVVLDLISVIFMTYIFQKLKGINAEYLEIMDDQRVQMSDFGVQVINVKLDRHSQDLRIQKMKLWLHFSEAIQAIRKEIIQKEGQNDQEDMASNSMKVIDVTLSNYAETKIQLIFKMQRIQEQINDIKGNIYAGAFNEDQYILKCQELKSLMKKLKKSAEKYQVITKPQENNHLMMQRIPKSQRKLLIKYAFITFKNCEANSMVSNVLEKEGFIIKLLRMCLRSRSEADKQQGKLLMGHELNVQAIIEPDDILWENLSFSVNQQTLRKWSLQIISVIFLLLAMVLQMYLDGMEAFVNQEVPASNCDQGEVISAADAYHWAVYLKNSNLLGCFCYKNVPPYKLWEVIPHSFLDAQQQLKRQGTIAQDTPDDKTRYCLDFYSRQYSKAIFLAIVPASAVLFNDIISKVFQKLGKWTKKHTKIEEQSTQFRQIFLIEFINMGLIAFIISFDQYDFTRTLMGGSIPATQAYQDYTSEWYMNVGVKLCVYIFLSSFFKNLADMFFYLLKALQRWRDRSYSSNMKLEPEDEDDDMPNTRLKLQADLEKLYTSKEFQGEKAYSRMMSTLFVVLMYGSGMPIMYIIATVFFSLTYFVNKYLIIKHYQKSSTLSRTIPLFSMKMLKYGLFIHMVNASLMLTNPQIFKTQHLDPDVKSLFNDTRNIHDLHFHVDNGTFAGRLHQVEQLQKAETGLENIIFQRFQFLHQQIYLMMLIAFFIIFIAGSTLAQIFTILKSALRNLLKDILHFFRTCIKKMIQCTKQVSILGHKLATMRANYIESVKQWYTNKKARRGLSQVDIDKNELEKQANKIIMKQANQRRSSIQNKRQQVDDDSQEVRLIGNEKRGNDQKKRANNIFDIQEDVNEGNQIVEKVQINSMKCGSHGGESNSSYYSEELVDELNSDYSQIQRDREEMEQQRVIKQELRQKRQRLLQKRMMRQDYSENILVEMSCENLGLFYQRAVMELSDFWDIFNFEQEITEKIVGECCQEDNSKERLRFEEICYMNRIRKDQVFMYQHMLQDRIKDIQLVIDKHFEMIKTKIYYMVEERIKKKKRKQDEVGGQHRAFVDFKALERETLNDPDLQFHKFSYEKKIELLNLFEEDLIKADKMRLENRQGVQEVCRMTGSLTQSYFIFDSQNYKVGRKLYYGLAQENKMQRQDSKFIDNLRSQKNKDCERKHQHGRKCFDQQQKSEMIADFMDEAM